MRAGVKRRGKISAIPEPSPRVVIWFTAIALAALTAVLLYDYSIGDPRLAWTASASQAKSR